MIAKLAESTRIMTQTERIWKNLAEYGIQNLLSLILSGLLKRVNFVFQILEWYLTFNNEKHLPVQKNNNPEAALEKF